MFFWSRKIKLIIEPRKRLSMIHFQKDSLDEIGKALKKYGKKYAILIDEGVDQLFGKEIRKVLKDKGIEAKYFTVPAGEKFKNLSTLEKLAEELVNNDITRSETFVAIGGGMTTDLVGFLAATYMRGVPVIHIPTTILGMVDAAIGGKNGVNLSSGKNLIGTVHQP
ncbi:MAG: iron-containing alcohol dehydrogenase, partial [Bacteroidota bacterium]